MQLFPWGGKLTSESIKFFSPIVIWTKFTSSPQKYDTLYSAFRDYYKVTPAYSGTELLPRSVFVDIKTPDGELNEHVEVLNACYGFTINYETGRFE